MSAFHHSAKDARIEDVAADWMTRRDVGFSPQDSEEFRLWIAADVRHAKAVADLEVAWSVLRNSHRQGDAPSFKKELRDRAARRLRRRIVWGLGATSAAALVAAVFFLTPIGIGITELVGPVATVSPRPDRMRLPDGSSVELNAGSEIVVNFQPEQRQVRLLRGDAHFDVAKDAKRPFVVAVGTTEVRAIGTQFLVSFSEEAIRVLVTEGKVAVKPAGDEVTGAAGTGPAPILLPAGTHLDIASRATGDELPAVLPVSNAERDQALAWREMRAEFNGTPLGEALAIFNQRNSLQLSLAVPELSSRRLTGVYWTNDAEGFARLLEHTLGLKAVRTGNLIRLDLHP